MASTRLTKTFSTPTNNKIWTLSFWVKRANLGASQWVINTDGGNQEDRLHFNPEDRLNYYEQDSGGSAVANFAPNAQLRDTNAWYHIVLTRDSTQATASDRLKMYYNGELQTVFLSNTYPSQNSSNRLNTAVEHEIGARNSSSYFDGSMSHIHFIDGTAYDASAFGQADANGVWTIKTSPSVTYGTNGFFILEDGNSVTDQSGNGNNWTVGGGTLTNTEDNPSNVFATMNPLSSQATLSNGNTKSQYGGGGIQRNSSPTTLGMLSGKYYCECKITLAGSTSFPGLGIAATNSLLSNKFGNYYLGEHSDTYGYYTGNGYIYNNTSEVASGLSIFATNDIAGLALDLDSAQNTLKFYKNGSLVYTLNITNNSNGWFFADTHESGELGARAEWNFGNGYFGTTAVASAGTNASGIGIFEYDVPTGYTALSTKGLDL